MATTKTKYRRTSKGIQVPQNGPRRSRRPVEEADAPHGSSGLQARRHRSVHVRIKEGEKERIQAYEGVVIARQNKGASKSFNVRKISHGVGVERIFLETSPKIAKIEIVQEGKVRRAKLYYLRGLEGKAAKIEREIETSESAAQSAAAKATK